MSARKWMFLLPLAAIVVVTVWQPSGASAQPAGGDPTAAAPQTKGIFDFIKAGGVVGYVIIALSFVSAALVIDTLRHTKHDVLMPPSLVEEAEGLARKGRFAEIQTMCKASQSMIARVISEGLSQGQLGLPSVRQAMQDQGARELGWLNQRVGYMGFIGSIGPMLGLLGTVLGMVSSFNVLGTSKGAARADELASGISYALVTTCEGLIVAIPMMFFHNYFRDRLAKLAQESAGLCERLLCVMSAVIEARAAAARGAARPVDAAAKAEVSTTQTV